MDRMLYSLDMAIRRTGRVTRAELEKVTSGIIFSFYFYFIFYLGL